MAVEKILLDIQAQVGDAKRDIRKLKNETSGLNKSVGKTEGLIKKAGAAFAGFVSVTTLVQGLKEIVRLNTEFEKTLTNVLTLLDKTDKAKFTPLLTKGSIQIIGKYGLEVKDVNKALFDTVSAGIKAGDSIKFLDEASKLAIGGVTDLKTAVDGMTSVMNAYKLGMEEANDVASAFFTAQKFGKTTVAELAQNIGLIAPIAKNAGIGFREVLSTLALLTKQGIRTDIATTALRATINALTNASKESKGAFKELGIESGVTALRSRGLAETLLQVAEVAEKDADKLGELIPNVRALVAVAALGTDALEEYDKILKNVYEDVGKNSSAAAAYEMQMDTLAGRFGQLKGSVQELMLTLQGEEGGLGLKDFLGGVNFIMKGINAKILRFQVYLDGVMGRTADWAFEFGKIPGVIDDIAESTNTVWTMFPKEEDWAMFPKDAFVEEVKEAVAMSEEEFERLMKLIRLRGRREEDEPPVVKQWIWGTDDEKEAFKKELDDDIDEMTKKTVEAGIKEADEKKKQGQTLAEWEKENEKKKRDAMLNITASSLKSAAALQERGSKGWKALNIAETLIGTYTSAQKAFEAMADIPVVGPILGTAAASTAVASGLARVAAIRSVPMPVETFGKGGFTGKNRGGYRDKDGPIAGVVHEDEFVFDKEKTKRLRPLFEDIHNERIDLRGLAAMTKRGQMQKTNKVNTQILEDEVKKIYGKMSEEKQEKPEIIQHGKGYTQIKGNTRIHVNT